MSSWSKGVDRASTTTVSALRTAVTVAQAMTNQKLVLEQIGALNTTTAGMIDSTGEMLRTQTGAIHEQAASSTIPLETLQRAFQNIYDTMDQIDQFKLQALGNMKQTVETLGKEVEKSKGYIARAEGVNQAKLEGAPSPLTPIEAQMTEVTDKVERAIARFERVTRQLDERDGPVREAARRERQRLNSDLASRVDGSASRSASSASSPSSSACSCRSACSASWLRSVWRSASRRFSPSRRRGTAQHRGAIGRSAQRGDGPALQFLSLPHAPRPARAGAGGDRRDQRRIARAASRRWSGSRRSIPTRRMRGA